MKRLNMVQATAIAAALSIATVAPIVLAQATAAPDGAGHERGGAWHGRGRADKAEFFGSLNLTDAQKTQLKQIRDSHRQTVESLSEQIRTKRQEVWQLQSGQTFDEAAAQAKLTEVASLEAKLMGERFRARQEMLAVLTPEQKAQVEQQKGQWQQKREQFRDRWNGRHERDAQQPNQ
jgi:protein CpxP